uniref:Proton-coupled amino acid transporter 1 n=1 Tax=Cacopsylla melanoneura TaxID=428564 RepID=A0A8D8RY62_9HEMI
MSPSIELGSVVCVSNGSPQFVKMKEKKEYDPFEHRSKENATSNWETMGHLITGSLGAGMLAIPIAFSHVGLVTGIIGVIVITILASYCMHQLLRVQYIICKKHRVSVMEYADVMKAALKDGPDCFKWLTKPSPYLVDFFVSAYQVGICCCALEFIAGSCKQFAEYRFGICWDIRSWMLITGLLVTPINQIRNLHLLSPLSVVGDGLIVGGLAIVYYFIFQEGVPSFEDRVWLLTDSPLKGFALFFGTVMYSVQTIGVIVALENNMKTPSDYRKPFGVFNLGMVIVAGADILIGFWGYAKWGDKTQSSITWNLPASSVLTQWLQLMFALQCLLSYPLQSFVPYEILWKNYLTRLNWKSFEQHEEVWSTILRAVIPWSTVLLSISIPFLDLLISFTGALCLPAVGITFPGILEICVFYDQKKLTPLNLAKNIFLILFGVLSTFISTYVCILSIVNQHGSSKHETSSFCTT